MCWLEKPQSGAHKSKMLSCRACAMWTRSTAIWETVENQRKDTKCGHDTVWGIHWIKYCQRWRKNSQFLVRLRSFEWTTKPTTNTSDNSKHEVLNHPFLVRLPSEKAVNSWRISQELQSLESSGDIASRRFLLRSTFRYKRKDQKWFTMSRQLSYEFFKDRRNDCAIRKAEHARNVVTELSYISIAIRTALPSQDSGHGLAIQ